jgi:hypothetical protein
MAKHSSWEGDAAGSLIGACVLLTIVIVVILGRIVLGTAKEIGRVYLENLRGRSARLLWYALGGLFGVWLLCGVVAAAAPAAGAVCVYTAAWAFLAYVVAIEVVDWQAQPGLPRPGDRDSLDTYLGGFGGTNADSLGSSKKKERVAADVAA